MSFQFGIDRPPVIDAREALRLKQEDPSLSWGDIGKILAQRLNRRRAFTAEGVIAAVKRYQPPTDDLHALAERMLERGRMCLHRQRQAVERLHQLGVPTEEANETLCQLYRAQSEFEEIYRWLRHQNPQMTPTPSSEAIRISARR